MGQVGRVGQAVRERQERQEGRERHEGKKRVDAEARKRARELQARQQRIDQLETRIEECEAAIRTIEARMAEPGFYEDRETVQPIIDEHQALMWKVGDLMHQWEMLHTVDRPAETVPRD